MKKRKHFIIMNNNSMLKAILVTMAFCMSLPPIHAQRITHNFHNTSMSEVLTQLAKSSKSYHINFMYNELEDFIVSTNIVKKTPLDAIQQVIGFYPIKVTIDGENIFVECTQKTPTKMMGRIIDTHRRPVDFANVALLNVRDSSFITGGVTNENGQFVIPCEARKAIVRVSCVGYHTAYGTYDTGKLGNITLKEATMNLQKVVVKGHQKTFEKSREGLLTNVQGTQLSHAGTANDVLKYVPMVTGKDGNFEVFGKGKPEIYINNRKVQGDQELAQLNSTDIKNVELITNPGAKYDGSVRSVIRIRTRRPQGEGWSGSITTQNGFQHYLGTVDRANLKYRVGGLEVFANMGYLNKKIYEATTQNMETFGENHWNQDINIAASGRSIDFFGKTGLSWQINDKQSIGAYYTNGELNQRSEIHYLTSSYIDETPYESFMTDAESRNKEMPSHHVNLYYNGEVGKLGVDFNMDYIWRKKNHPEDFMENNLATNEMNQIHSTSQTRRRMIAEKLVLSYPFWKGNIEIGNEFTSSRVSNDFAINFASMGSSLTVSKENNMAGFAQITQQWDKFGLQAGLRYEHVKFNYWEDGQAKTDQSKTYNNLFPSISLDAELGKTQWTLSYTGKTQRPSYEDLDGTISYVNPLLVENGNPYLSPMKIHTIELNGAWESFFWNLSYTHTKDAVLNVSKPYGEDGKVKLLTMENEPKIQRLQAFVGTQQQFGIWQPKLNVGITKQWFTIDYQNERKSMGKPYGLVQFQNAIHLPADIWLNLDMQWQFAGNEDNQYLGSASYVNAKLYKAFCKNRFSVSIEANDIFNKSNYNLTLYTNQVKVFQDNRKSDSRTMWLTLQYNFNTTKSRYKGTGAGNAEQNRL